MKQISKTTWWMIGGAGVATISVLAFFYFDKRFKNKSNTSYNSPILGKSKTINVGSNAATRQVPDWNAPFDMNYSKEVQQWLTPKNIELLDMNTANSYAKKIKSAKRTFNDDEAAIRTLFSKRLKDKTQVSQVSLAFWKRYKIDMWQYLNSFLSPKELHQNVTLFVKQLPNYTAA